MLVEINFAGQLGLLFEDLLGLFSDDGLILLYFWLEVDFLACELGLIVGELLCR